MKKLSILIIILLTFIFFSSCKKTQIDIDDKYEVTGDYNMYAIERTTKYFEDNYGARQLYDYEHKYGSGASEFQLVAGTYTVPIDGTYKIQGYLNISAWETPFNNRPHCKLKLISSYNGTLADTGWFQSFDEGVELNIDWEGVLSNTNSEVLHLEWEVLDDGGTVWTLYVELKEYVFTVVESPIIKE